MTRNAANWTWIICFATIIFILILPFILIRYVTEYYSNAFDWLMDKIYRLKVWVIGKLSNE